MNRFNCMVLFLFGVALPPAVAQLPVQAIPIWEQSFGNREHTNRDELIQMAKDPSGNLILLGFVERDSTFSDVSVQKISPEGSLLWDFRFDSQNEKDYDVPIKMAVDAQGDVTVLGLSNGIVSFFSVQKSNGFLFKVSLEGSVLQSFTKNEITQALGGGISASGQAIDSVGNFVFVQYDETNYPKHAIRTINPETSTDQIKLLNLDNLSFQDSLCYAYLSWVHIWIDDNREVYTANNLEPPLGPAFYLSKVKPNGEVKYILRAKDSTNIYFNSLEPWRGYAYATGSYIPKNSNKRVAFIWKINGQGIIEEKIIQVLPNHCVPRFLDIVDGNIYWSTEDVVTGAATLKELSALDLTVSWEYTLHKPAESMLTGSNLLVLPNGKSVYAGTLRKEKQPGSSYLSEEDFYVETFEPTPNELYAQYRMTELGTTHVESDAFSIDPNGNIYTRATEVDGPKYYLIQYTPRKYYYRKFSPDGTLIWEKESERQAYYQYGINAFYFDYEGNAYALEYVDQSGYLLVKISPDGESIGSYALPGFLHLFIDRQNRLHLTYWVGNNNVLTTLLLDNNFQLISSGYQGLTPTRMFQLPTDNAVYYYMEDRADWGESTVRMILFKDGQQLWEKVFNFPSPEYQYFASHDLDANSGTLVSSSIWRDNAGFFQFAFHKFTIDNNYATQIVPTSDNIYPFIGTYLENKNTYLVYPTKLDLYNPDFQLLQSIPISDTLGGGYFLKSNNTLLRALNGILEGYSGDGQSEFSLTHPSFYFDPFKIAISPNNQLITSDIFGDWIGGGYDFGWRWYRGKIQAFDLSDWVTSSTNAPFEKEIQVICSPNPVSELLHVDLRQMRGNGLRLTLFNLLGSMVATQVFQSGIPAEAKLDLSTLPGGTYFLEVNSPGSVPFTQKIIHLKP